MKEVLLQTYRNLFQRHWPPWLAGFLLGTANTLLFAYAEPWTTFQGVIHWGQNLLQLFGFLQGDEVFPAHLSPHSVLNLSFILGAAAAALLSREFALRRAPALEVLKALVGGTLMGIGANLSLGCNIGGFFSAVSALSASGFTMMIGLIAGAYLGLRYLLWETEKLPPRFVSSSKYSSSSVQQTRLQRYQPLLGTALLVMAVFLAHGYAKNGYSKTAIFLIFGLFLGLVNQRSRFCFVRAFREPFLTGDASMTRGTLMGLAVGILGFSLIKWASLQGFEDRLLDGVRPTFWQGSLPGGILFGFGMSLTGGCASGSMWRAGEGHLKLWLALLAFALSGAGFNSFLIRSGWIDRLGTAVFLPEKLGWEAALLIALSAIALLSLLATWNEINRKFTLI